MLLSVRGAKSIKGNVPLTFFFILFKFKNKWKVENYADFFFNFPSTPLSRNHPYRIFNLPMVTRLDISIPNFTYIIIIICPFDKVMVN